MANNELNALQVNFKTSGGSLFNVYGKTAEDFEHNLKMFNALLEEIMATEAAVAGGRTPAADPVSVVAAAFPGSSVVQSAPKQSTAAPSGNPVCKHGPMSFVDGTKKGKNWKAWMCSAGQNAPDKCDPQWVK